MERQYTTYVIQSLSSGKLYIGQTGNLEDRLLRHNRNRSQYTKNKGPWKLIFSRSFASRGEAVTLEQKLKQFKSRRYVLEWITAQAGLEHPDKSGGT